MFLGPTADIFIVSGRGGLHLGILIETMRREGYEFAVGPMTVRLFLSNFDHFVLGHQEANQRCDLRAV